MDPAPHPSNRLNDLTNRDWLRETKSFWRSQPDEAGATGWTAEDVADLAQWLRDTRGEERAEELLQQAIPSAILSQAPPRGKLKALHPATFSERDVARLIRFFTKEGETVLDPFLGSGSTLLACGETGRRGVGIELIERWAEVSRERLADAAFNQEQQIIQGEAREELGKLPEDSCDFVVTSPPYWSILQKKGMKVAAERESRGLPTQYSEAEDDLGNVEDYGEFLAGLAEVFGECGRVLKAGGYLAVIVSDFRHGPHFVLFHADLADRIEAVGLPLKGITVLLQDNKNLYPLGIPYAFVSNIHHQYILIHQKPR